MRPGWNATRRNKNIGIAKQGHGQDNKLVIPYCLAVDKLFYENLTSYTTVVRSIHGNRFTFIVEKTRDDCFHACTVDDLAYLLGKLPLADIQRVDLIVLRQPKRKEDILNGAWGRAAFFVEIGPHRGSAIFIEAQNVKKPIRWTKSLPPDGQSEFERLRSDGHKIITTSHDHVIERTLDSVRATQLYRTLLHEIGHHIDYRRASSDAWDQKSSLEKETFAHQYADAMREKLTYVGILPFDRILNHSSLARDGLLLSDFRPGS